MDEWGWLGGARVRHAQGASCVQWLGVALQVTPAVIHCFGCCARQVEDDNTVRRKVRFSMTAQLRIAHPVLFCACGTSNKTHFNPHKKIPLINLQTHTLFARARGLCLETVVDRHLVRASRPEPLGDATQYRARDACCAIV